MHDYSKGIIYKWVCDDCEEIYVGSTINFTRRKQQHKTSCNNEKDAKHHLKIYQTMRENGGFGNWRMIQIESYPCQSKRELEAREEEVRQDFKAVLNSQKAYTTGEDKRTYRANYYRQNIDKRKEYNETNDAKIKEYYQNYRNNNADKIKESKKIYYELNKSRISDRQKQYYELNKSRILDRQKQYYESKKS
jgi:hypothetical protein